MKAIGRTPWVQTVPSLLVVGLVIQLMAAGMVIGVHSTTVDAQGEPNAMALDADPSTAAVDGGVAMPLDVEFDVGVNISAAGTAYAGYNLKVQFDSSRLVWVSVPPSGFAYVNSESHGMSINAQAYPSPNMVEGGAIRPGDTTNFTGTVALLRFKCVAPGLASLTLVPPDPGPPLVSNTTTLGSGGAIIGTALVGSQVSCGEGAGPATTTPSAGIPTVPPGPTPTTPQGPTPTPAPTPPPESAEVMNLIAGCNPITTTYPDGTTVQTLTAATAPAGTLDAIWKFDAGVWRAYSPEFPQASDLAVTAFLDVVFLCVDAPATLVRPLV
jgi:hypothetical protein